MEGDAATPDAAAEAAPSVDVEPDTSEPAVQIPQNERGQRREKTIARLEANIAKAGGQPPSHDHKEDPGACS